LHFAAKPHTGATDRTLQEGGDKHMIKKTIKRIATGVRYLYPLSFATLLVSALSILETANGLYDKNIQFMPPEYHNIIYLHVLCVLSDLIILYCAGTFRSFHDFENDIRRPFGGIAAKHCIARLALIIPDLFLSTGAFVIENLGAATVAHYCLQYAASACSIVFAVDFILVAAQNHNPKWLAGNKGQIGIANQISAVRIGIALLVPHIAIADSFAPFSRFVISAILTLAIATDKLDGTIARKTSSTTRAGMALDPIGDKALFYPAAVGFAVLMYRDIPDSDTFRLTISVAAIVIILARDALILAWFSIYGRKTHDDISATRADKLRMVVLCVWILSTAYYLSFDGLFSDIMKQISFYSLAACALASVVSVVSDFHSTSIKEKF